MQSDESARRIIDMGADPMKVTVTGSLKFESVEPPAAVSAGRGEGRVLRYFRMTPNRLVIIAASTHTGEEAMVLRAFAAVRRQHGNAMLVIAPRRLERVGEVDALARGVGYRVSRRSDLPVDAEPRDDVVVLDTVGELSQLFQIATIVFVGGSLINWGGHNVLEPAVHGKPIVFGPFMQNFAEIASAFVSSQAGIQVDGEAGLSSALVRLAGDSVERARLGAAARALVEANRGATPRTIDAIEALLPPPNGRAVVRPFRVVN
jgi:3-deoxy-D-manno-octulosonic-acid transferase